MIGITTFLNSFTFGDSELPTAYSRVLSAKSAFESDILSHSDDNKVLNYAIKNLLCLKTLIASNREALIKLQHDYQAENTEECIDIYSQLASIVDYELQLCNQFITSTSSITIEAECPQQEEQNSCQSLYKTLHDLYGETITAKQLCDFYHVGSRTISNWEDKGYIENISSINDEIKSDGKKKRGEEKRYLTSQVARNVEMQLKFNKLR